MLAGTESMVAGIAAVGLAAIVPPVRPAITMNAGRCDTLQARKVSAPVGNRAVRLSGQLWEDDRRRCTRNFDAILNHRPARMPVYFPRGPDLTRS